MTNAIAALKRAWGLHPRLLLAFLAAAAVTLFCVVRIVVFTVYWADPAHRNVDVQPWMTVGYIARSWHVDPHALDDVAGLPPPDGRPKPLAEIARDRGVPVADVITAVEDGIAVLLMQKVID